MKRGTWINKKRKITGWWQYNWSADRFTIILDSKDRITGRNRSIVTEGINSRPEWGNWMLVR